jgi:thymidylate kinase
MADARQRGASSAISSKQPYLVSFSGIDGAGKTTQIDTVLVWLRDVGLQVRLLRFWDDIAVAGRLRATMSHTLFKSEKGIGAPDKPVQRRDKNVRAWYMTAARLLLYFLDAARLPFVVATASRTGADVILFDRYLYDELANLDTAKPVARAYVRLLLKLVPRPNVAFLLDAEPAQARARKPEYPLDFLNDNRAQYMALAKFIGMTVVKPLAVKDVTRTVLEEMSAALFHAHTDDCSGGHPMFTADLTSKLG